MKQDEENLRVLSQIYVLFLRKLKEIMKYNNIN